MTTIVYHSADYDGIFCREIAKKFLPEATLIGWNFGDPPLQFPESGNVYVMDLPVDEPFAFKYDKTGHGLDHGLDHLRVIWIDHHKSSIESHPNRLMGYRIDGVAACRLAWQWFSQRFPFSGKVECSIMNLPDKKHFVDRLVDEPQAVRLAGEYDIGDKRDPDAETFQYGLSGWRLSDADWKDLLATNEDGRPEPRDSLVRSILDKGRTIQEKDLSRLYKAIA